jgi:hypothetical protein
MTIGQMTMGGEDYWQIDNRPNDNESIDWLNDNWPNDT